MGMGQNKTTRKPQVLVFASICQGVPFLVRTFDPQPYDKKQSLADLGTASPELSALCFRSLGLLGLQLWTQTTLSRGFGFMVAADLVSAGVGERRSPSTWCQLSHPTFWWVPLVKSTTFAGFPFVVGWEG